MKRSVQAMLITAFAVAAVIAASVAACTSSGRGNVCPLNAAMNFKFPPGFPPDPGEAGKRTLEGIDSDHDGIRDDVQRYIHARYPLDADKPKRAALRQLARNLQWEAAVDLNDAQLKESEERGDQSLECLNLRFPNMPDGYVELQYLEAKVYNTAARTKMHLLNDQKFDGKMLESLPSQGEKSCDP